jgi:adenosylhomocysteine nucleosidase
VTLKGVEIYIYFMIAIVCAMSTEVEPIKAQMNILKKFCEDSATFYQAEFHGFPITIVQTGVGRDKATAATRRLLQLFKINLVITTGFAGGLREEIKIGDVVIAKNALYIKHVEPAEVVFKLSCDASYVRVALDIGNEKGLRVHEGDTVTVDELIAQSKAKMFLGNNFSALAVDMETAFVGQVASGAGIPFVSVRTISDDVKDDIVVDYKRFVDEGGNVRIRSALTQILHIVPHALHLRRMHKQARIAAGTLAVFLPHFITSSYNQILF